MLMGELDKAIADFIKGQELRSEESKEHEISI